MEWILEGASRNLNRRQADCAVGGGEGVCKANAYKGLAGVRRNILA
jgi:hypothetical protein